MHPEHGLRRIIGLLGKDLRLYRQSFRGRSPRENKKMSTLLHSGMGIGARTLGKETNPRSETSSETLMALSFCLGSPPLHFISAPPGPVHEGGDKRQRSSNFFLTDVVVGWKVTGLPLFTSRFSLHDSSEECDVDPLWVLGGSTCSPKEYIYISFEKKNTIGVGYL